jgi:hypothetical protein
MKTRTRLLWTFILLTFVMSTYGYLMNKWWNRPLDQIVGVALILAATTTLIMWFVWEADIIVKKRERVSPSAENKVEKRKRDRLDSVLRDLSDADLLHLRQRLNDGTINDDSLEEELIGEDGELLYQEKQR